MEIAFLDLLLPLGLIVLALSCSDRFISWVVDLLNDHADRLDRAEAGIIDAEFWEVKSR